MSKINEIELQTERKQKQISEKVESINGSSVYMRPENFQIYFQRLIFPTWLNLRYRSLKGPGSELFHQAVQMANRQYRHTLFLEKCNWLGSDMVSSGLMDRQEPTHRVLSSINLLTCIYRIHSLTQLSLTTRQSSERH